MKIFFLIGSGCKKFIGIFKLCFFFKMEDDVIEFEYWISEIWVNLVMGMLYVVGNNLGLFIFLYIFLYFMLIFLLYCSGLFVFC